MNKQQYSELLEYKTQPVSIKAEDYPIGTLTYGYDADRTTIHVYVDYFQFSLKEKPVKAIYIHKVNHNKLVGCEVEVSFPAYKLKPGKRSYANYTRFDFAKDMVDAGYPLSLTSTSELTDDDLCGEDVFFGFTIKSGDYYVQSNREVLLGDKVASWIEDELLVSEVIDAVTMGDCFSQPTLESIKSIYGYHDSILGLTESALYPFVALDEALSYWHHNDLSVCLAGDFSVEFEKTKKLVNERIDKLCNSLASIHEIDLSSYDEVIRKMAIDAEKHILETQSER